VGVALTYNNLDNHKLSSEYFEKANKVREEYCNSMTYLNYKRLSNILARRQIKLVCAQYPMRSIESLKSIFEGQSGIIFVDNERTFKKAVQKAGYEEYFKDVFGGDFGHCTRKGYGLLAENIANVILKEVFHK